VNHPSAVTVQRGWEITLFRPLAELSAFAGIEKMLTLQKKFVPSTAREKKRLWRRLNNW